MRVLTVDKIPSNIQTGDVIYDQRSVDQIRLKQFLDYELGASSWWVGWISNSWLQDRVASYFGRKVKRKYKRYQGHLALKDALSKIQ